MGSQRVRHDWATFTWWGDWDQICPLNINNDKTGQNTWDKYFQILYNTQDRTVIPRRRLWVWQSLCISVSRHFKTGFREAAHIEYSHLAELRRQISEFGDLEMAKIQKVDSREESKDCGWLLQEYSEGACPIQLGVSEKQGHSKSTVGHQNQQNRYEH